MKYNLKKPIEAIQFTKDNFEKVRRFLYNHVDHLKTWEIDTNNYGYELIKKSRLGVVKHIAFADDYIVINELGTDFDIVDKSSFESKYKSTTKDRW